MLSRVGRVRLAQPFMQGSSMVAQRDFIEKAPLPRKEARAVVLGMNLLQVTILDLPQEL